MPEPTDLQTVTTGQIADALWLTEVTAGETKAPSPEPQPDADPDTTEPDVHTRAVDAAMRVFDHALKLSSPHRHVVEEALDAAGEVFDTDRDANAERMVAETGLVSMEALPDQGVRLRIALGLDLATKMLGAFRELLDAHPAAVNYVEQEFISHETGQSYAVIVCRPGGQKPHQLRRAAEQERDQALARAREFAAREVQNAEEIMRLRDTLNKVADLAYRAGPGAAAQDALAEIQTQARRAAGDS